MAAPRWFIEMLGWKAATDKATPRCMRLFGVPFGPNLADLSGTGSTAISGRVYELLGVSPSKTTSLDLDAEAQKSGDEDEGGSVSPLEQTLAEEVASTGTALERGLETDIRTSLETIAPDRDWHVARSGGVGRFAQFTHLAELQKLFEDEPTLRSTIGRDYHVSTDVMVSVPDPSNAGGPRVLHAAVSSKLTIRSDRVQNIRYEFGTLVRNRRGRSPHLVVVTAEPLPSRLVSIGRGLGEIDAVYHLLFDEMDEALSAEAMPNFRARDWQEQRRDWRELVEQKRIKPYSELAPLIAAG